jgi:2'-5' RNA ligase
VEAAAALERSLGPEASAYRFTDPATLHLTVRFLGAVPEAALAPVGAAVRAAAAAARPFTLHLAGAGAFPTPRRPRAVTLLLGGEVAALQALTDGLERGLMAAGLPPERRPLRPHVTVARARDRRGGPDLSAALAALGAPPLRWEVTALTLFESHLERGGARHEAILVAPFGA